MQLTFRPVIDTLAGGGARDMLAPAFGSPLDAEGNPLPAACAAGRLETILGEGRGGGERGKGTPMGRYTCMHHVHSFQSNGALRLPCAPRQSTLAIDTIFICHQTHCSSFQCR